MLVQGHFFLTWLCHFPALTYCSSFVIFPSICCLHLSVLISVYSFPLYSRYLRKVKSRSDIATLYSFLPYPALFSSSASFQQFCPKNVVFCVPSSFVDHYSLLFHVIDFIWHLSNHTALLSLALFSYHFFIHCNVGDPWCSFPFSSTRTIFCPVLSSAYHRSQLILKPLAFFGLCFLTILIIIFVETTACPKLSCQCLATSVHMGKKRDHKQQVEVILLFYKTLLRESEAGPERVPQHNRNKVKDRAEVS